MGFGKKTGLTLILCFWVLGSFSQNYADSALIIFEQIEIDSLSDFALGSLEKHKAIILSTDEDTLMLTSIYRLVCDLSDNTARKRFNELLGKFVENRLTDKRYTEQKNLYLEFKTAHLSKKASRLASENKIEASLKLRYESLAIREKLKDTASIAFGYKSLGIFCFNNNDFEQAESWWQKALRFNEILRDTVGESEILFYLSALLIKEGKPREAIPYLKENLKKARSVQAPEHLQIQVLMALGNAYQMLEEFDAALIHFEEAYEFSLKIGLERGYTGILTSLSIVSTTLGKWDDGKKYALENLRIARKSDNVFAQKNAAESLSLIYEHEGNDKKCLEMVRIYYRIKDSIQSESNIQIIIKKEYEYDLEKQREIDSLKNAQVLTIQVAENKRRKNTSYFLIACLILAGIFAAILFNRFRITSRQKVALDQANEQLKELDQNKSRFFTNISHEFRTPLTVISGMADMISDAEPKDLIKRNSQSLLRLVNQILDLRKLESGKLPLNMQQGNIIPHLKYLLESFQSYAETKGVVLQFTSSEEELVMDYDTEKLHSIFTNLISNAIKFTPEEGGVSLQCAVGSMPSKNSNLPTADSLRLTVSDTGIGIPPAKLPHIFDRFYQVDDSSTRVGEGTGIGLTLTHELIHLIGGDIQVESEVGRGTDFMVTLPITQNAPLVDIQLNSEAAMHSPSFLALNPPPAVSSLSSAPYKLLIVEDNPDVVRYLQACLNDLYQVSIAKDGQEGIEKAIAEVPDIIISDVMMPRKDGFELCQTLKNDERTSHIPIILLTAKADVESRISGLKRGADAYLAKPFDKAELMVRLEMLIKLRQQLQTRYQQVEKLEPSEDIAIKQEDVFIQKLTAAIHEHLTDSDLNITKLCEMMSMSRTQLHNKVKALTGKAASAYLRSVRLQEAKNLLQDPSLNISDIAYQVGFNDPGYFTRTFVKEFGFAPSERKK